jgi:type I restriction enzyme, S subunit
MPGEATRKTMGDYFTLQRGTTYKSRLLDLPGPVLLGLASIERNGGFKSTSLRTYGGESPDKLIVKPGELYLSLKDVTQSADLLGAVARLPDDHQPGRLTQDTVKLEPLTPDAPLDSIYWLLRTPEYRAYCRAHATGTTNLGLARDDFLAFPVPEITSERGAIVTVLTWCHRHSLDVRPSGGGPLTLLRTIPPAWEGDE